jgi:hypothetical protein
VAPKRKGLGKQNFERVKDWVNEKQNSRVNWVMTKYCRFRSMTRSDIEN